MSYKLDYYVESLKKWQNFYNTKTIKENIKRVFTEDYKPFWMRSASFYEENIKRLKNNKEQNPLDDEHLRSVILPILPTNDKHIFDMQEIWDNWHNKNWWYENFRDLFNMIENMYVKKSVKEDLKNKNCLPKGPYHSYFTRLIQYLNTFRAEPIIVQKLDLNLELESHKYLHDGIASEKESLPDYTYTVEDRHYTAELKICTGINLYQEKLLNNFDYVVKNDFHGADTGIFLVKGSTLKLYVCNLTDKDNLYFKDITDKHDLSDIKLFLTDDDGHLDKANFPALHPSLLFGFKARWLK